MSSRDGHFARRATEDDDEHDDEEHAGDEDVSQGESRYGTPEPQIALRFPKGTSYRVV